MKINQLFEYNYDIKKIPFEYEAEWEGDPSWDPETQHAPVVVFTGYVYITPDMYGTGDSPTDYSVEFTDAKYKNTKQSIPFKHFDEQFLDYIEQKIVDKVA